LEQYFGPSAHKPGRFVRRSPDPVIGTVEQWCSDFVAITSCVRRGSELWLYAEGSSAGHEQIGLFTGDPRAPEQAFSGHPANPVLRVGGGAYADGGVFDPSVVRFGGVWYLYFSATEGDAHDFAHKLAHGEDVEGPVGEWIGVATSDDGVTFTKHDDGPVMPGRCPVAFVWDGVVYLYHVKVQDGGYRIHLSTSRDGFEFTPHGSRPVLDVGAEGEWDCRSVTTPKVVADGGRFWMTYAGDASGFDDLSGVGIAWSDDLVTWTKAPSNPVFGLGEEGAFDGVSVQSPLLVVDADRVLLFYAGSDTTVGEGLHSQVGLAELVPGDPV
jgi:GH43 family beta-xylosidase